MEQLHGGKHRKILLVSHAATVIALTRELMGDGALPMRVACCSLTTLKRPKEDVHQAVGVWMAQDLAVGHFLRGGLERDWGLEDVELNGREVSVICLLPFELIIHYSQVVNDPGDPGTEKDVQEAVGLQVDILSRM